MKNFVVLSAALVAVTAPVTATYAAPGAHGGGGGGKAPAFTFSVPGTSTVDQSAVQRADLTVTRAAANPADITSCTSTVTYATSDATGTGAAVAGTDYTAVTAGTVTFNPGATTATASVTLLHETDNTSAADTTEHFQVTISSPTTSCKGKKSAIAAGAGTDTVSIVDGRTVVLVPAGDEVQVINPTFAGCANLDGTLTVGDASVGFGGIAGDCFDANHKDNQHISPDPSSRVATIALADNGCGVTYFSDTTSAPGTSVNHALMTPVSTGVWDFALADGGGGGSQCGTWRIPANGDGFNFTGTIQLVSSKPETPGSFSVTPDSTAGIDLSWAASATADAYDIYRGPDSSSLTWYAQWNATPFTDTSTTSGNQYCYGVVALNDLGGSTATAVHCTTAT